MPNANYYREQARLLLYWAMAASNPETAERLSKRAQQMLDMAQRADSVVETRVDALDVFNASQMTPRREKQPSTDPGVTPGPLPKTD
jgi:hypothetical protein